MIACDGTHYAASPVYADELIEPWRRPLDEELAGVPLFDAHTHTGTNDPDGFRCTSDELLAALELAGARAVVFTMQEPGGYSEANDRVLAEAKASGGRLVPFCRLDPRRSPVEEARRCLDDGARGIKLHPRAERFSLSDPEVGEVFELAAGRRAPVLVHAGRGIPALGRHALERAAQYPEVALILAHAGICDLAWIWREAPEHPNLLFDTAWWTATDLLALFALVPPGQVLFASDTPYGTPLQALVATFRCALQAGLSRSQLQSVGGGQLERLLAGEAPLDCGPPPGAGQLASDALLDRVYSFLVTAIGQMLMGRSGEEALALARLACEVGEDAPQAEPCRSVLALLDRHARYGAGRPPEGPVFPGVHLVVLAAVVARTPGVALPRDVEPVAVDERSGEAPSVT